MAVVALPGWAPPLTDTLHILDAPHLAATLPEPAVDLTLVCYDNEEVEASRNGLGRVARTASASSTYVRTRLIEH